MSSKTALFCDFVPRFCLILKVPITTGEDNTFCGIFLDCWQKIHMKYQALFYFLIINNQNLYILSVANCRPCFDRCYLSGVSK